MNLLIKFVREYVSDYINEILEARKINTVVTQAVEATTTILSTNCRIVPGTDGKFYVYDEDKIRYIMKQMQEALLMHNRKIL